MSGQDSIWEKPPLGTVVYAIICCSSNYITLYNDTCAAVKEHHKFMYIWLVLVLVTVIYSKRHKGKFKINLKIDSKKKVRKSEKKEWKKRERDR